MTLKEIKFVENTAINGYWSWWLYILPPGSEVPSRCGQEKLQLLHQPKLMKVNPSYRGNSIQSCIQELPHEHSPLELQGRWALLAVLAQTLWCIVCKGEFRIQSSCLCSHLDWITETLQGKWVVFLLFAERLLHNKSRECLLPKQLIMWPLHEM